MNKGKIPIFQDDSTICAFCRRLHFLEKLKIGASEMRVDMVGFRAGIKESGSLGITFSGLWR